MRQTVAQAKLVSAKMPSTAGKANPDRLFLTISAKTIAQCHYLPKDATQLPVCSNRLAIATLGGNQSALCRDP
jgi:hypothetical protein